MSLVLLPNTWGAQASGIELGVTSPSILPGFALDRIISGGRQDSMSVMTEQNTSIVSFRYTNSVAIPWTHVVVARGDRIAFSPASIDLEVYADISGTMTDLGSFTELYGFDFFGKGYGQDSVFTAASRRTSDIRTEIRFNSGDLCSKQINKFYVSDAFSFGSEPEMFDAPRWKELPSETAQFRPLNGNITYKVQSELTLVWTDVDKSKVAEFLSIPHLLSWPIFLYDDDGAVFPWKLEHVIINTYTISAQSPDYATITINFLRLEHYR